MIPNLYIKNCCFTKHPLEIVVYGSRSKISNLRRQKLETTTHPFSPAKLSTEARDEFNPFKTDACAWRFGDRGIRRGYS